jgi:WD40 repeat protein
MRRDAIDGASGSACAPSLADDERGPARTDRMRAGISAPSRALKGLIALGLVGLVGLSAHESGPEPARMRLVLGGAGPTAIGFALSPDGRTIATTHSHGRWSLRDLRDERGTERLVGHYRGPAWAPAFSPDGRRLVLGRGELGVLLLDLAAGGHPVPLDLPRSAVRALAFSPDGRTLAAAAWPDVEIVLWDLATNRERTRLRDRSRALSLAFSPDGRSLAAGEQCDQRIILWDLETGRSRSIYEEPAGHITSVAFSPDGRLLAAAGPAHRNVRLWDPGSGRLRRQVAGHVGGALSVAFSPDGGRLATSGNDGMARIWNVATAELLTCLDGRTMRLTQVAFSADGRTLVAIGSDDHVRVWDLDDIDKANADSTLRRSSGQTGRMRSRETAGFLKTPASTTRLDAFQGVEDPTHLGAANEGSPSRRCVIGSGRETTALISVCEPSLARDPGWTMRRDAMAEFFKIRVSPAPLGRYRE